MSHTIEKETGTSVFDIKQQIDAAAIPLSIADALRARGLKSRGITSTGLNRRF